MITATTFTKIKINASYIYKKLYTLKYSVKIYVLTQVQREHLYVTSVKKLHVQSIYPVQGNEKNTTSKPAS